MTKTRQTERITALMVIALVIVAASAVLGVVGAVALAAPGERIMLGAVGLVGIAGFVCLLVELLAIRRDHLR